MCAETNFVQSVSVLCLCSPVYVTANFPHCFLYLNNIKTSNSMVWPFRPWLDQTVSSSSKSTFHTSLYLFAHVDVKWASGALNFRDYHVSEMKI